MVFKLRMARRIRAALATGRKRRLLKHFKKTKFGPEGGGQKGKTPKHGLPARKSTGTVRSMRGFTVRAMSLLTQGNADLAGHWLGKQGDVSEILRFANELIGTQYISKVPEPIIAGKRGLFLARAALAIQSEHPKTVAKLIQGMQPWLNEQKTQIQAAERSGLTKGPAFEVSVHTRYNLGKTYAVLSLLSSTQLSKTAIAQFRENARRQIQELSKDPYVLFGGASLAQELDEILTSTETQEKIKNGKI
ncbi:MAG: hypothetical protein Q7S92_04840 [Candidatus Diapherotrites archaeon]|nr:hypothetical protein [Candidatus Diapherotrites archaeon]